jgi:hypothetical protein
MACLRATPSKASCDGSIALLTSDDEWLCSTSTHQRMLNARLSTPSPRTQHSRFKFFRVSGITVIQPTILHCGIQSRNATSHCYPLQQDGS